MSVRATFAPETNGDLSCKELLQSANHSYETLLHSSMAADDIRTAAADQRRHSKPSALTGEHFNLGGEMKTANGRKRRDVNNGGALSLTGNGTTDMATSLSPLPSTAATLAAMGSASLQADNHSALTARNGSLNHQDYTYVSTDSIRQLQEIRGNLRHVLHSDLAGVEELLLSKLALIRKQESSTELTLKNTSDVTTMVNTSLHSENELLRNTLDRERFRRKQYEKQTETLQGRLGEEHQQFSSALEALKRKDNMIEQLDKTLAKVVEGWQIHEGERQQSMKELEKSHQQLARELSEQREVSSGLEVELTTAIDDLAKEHEHASILVLEKGSRILLMEEELKSLSDKLEVARDAAHRLELERSEASESRDRAVNHLNALRASLTEERKAFQEKEQELIAKIDEISGLQISVLENEQKKASDLERNLTNVETQLCSAIRNIEALTTQLKEAELDKERALCEVTTLKEKHKAQLKQQDSDLKLQTADTVLRLRQEWAERLSGRETELSHAHRQQVAELHERHARQTAELTARHHSEMSELRLRNQSQAADLTAKIDRLEEEVHQLRYTKRRMEAQHREITQRLQSMMTLHASEALKILTTASPSADALNGKVDTGAHILSHSYGQQVFQPQVPAAGEPQRSLGSSSNNAKQTEKGAEAERTEDASVNQMKENAESKNGPSDETPEYNMKSQVPLQLETHQVALKPVAILDEHILPIELAAYGMSTPKQSPTATAPSWPSHHDSRYTHPHMVDSFARHEARYGHSYHTPSADEFLTYLRETQSSTNYMLNMEEPIAGQQEVPLGPGHCF